MVYKMTRLLYITIKNDIALSMKDKATEKDVIAYLNATRGLLGTITGIIVYNPEY